MDTPGSTPPQQRAPLAACRIAGPGPGRYRCSDAGTGPGGRRAGPRAGGRGRPGVPRGRPYYYDEGYYRPVVVEYDRWRRPVYYRYGPPPRPVVVYRPAPHYHPPVPRYRVSYDPRHDRWDRDDRRHYRKHDTHGHRGHRGHRDRDDWDD